MVTKLNADAVDGCSAEELRSQGFDYLDPLLPFDPETELLFHDIALVHSLARAALRANAPPLGGGLARGQ